jgi:hypothetical protein
MGYCVASCGNLLWVIVVNGGNLFWVIVRRVVVIFCGLCGE